MNACCPSPGNSSDDSRSDGRINSAIIRCSGDFGSCKSDRSVVRLRFCSLRFRDELNCFRVHVDSILFQRLSSGSAAPLACWRARLAIADFYPGRNLFPCHEKDFGRTPNAARHCAEFVLDRNHELTRYRMEDRNTLSSICRNTCITAPNTAANADSWVA